MTKAEHNRLYRDRHRAKWNAYRRRWRAGHRDRLNSRRQEYRAADRAERAFWLACFADVKL